MNGSSETVVLDKQAALDRIDGDVELYREIVQLFLEDCPLQLTLLDGAVACEDRLLVERQAHSLKSAAANIGGEAMRYAASELEAVARSASPDVLDTLRGKLREQFERLKERCVEP